MPIQITPELVIKAAGWLIGIVGALLVFSGGLIGYIFMRHVREDDERDRDNCHEHELIRQEINEHGHGKRK